MSKARYYFLFELLVLIRTAANEVISIAVTVLVQDKICLNQFHQSQEYCQHINNESLADQSTRDNILADSTRFNTYKSLIECVPMFLWSLFAGSFLDKYPGGTRLMYLMQLGGDLIGLVLTCVNTFFFGWNVYFILLPSLSYLITGGMANFYTINYRYMVMTTDEKIRPLKFMLFGLVAFLGLTIGNYVGGQILLYRAANSSFPQIRTYYFNLALNLALNLISLGLIFTLRDANPPTESAQSIDNENYQETGNSLGNISGDTSSEAVERTTQIDHHRQSTDHQTQDGQPAKKESFIKVLLDFDNLKETIQCFTKNRQDHIRLQIYLLFTILFATSLITNGNTAVNFQFTEKVYHWDPKTYTTYFSLLSLFQMVVVFVPTGVMVKRFNFKDEPLLLVALCSTFVSQVILGTYLKPMSFVIGQLAGSFGGFAALCTRNKVSRIIPSDEVGKVFSLSSIIEATMPFFGAVIYSNLFAVSITNLPGLIFLFGALVTLLAMVVFGLEEVYCNNKMGLISRIFSRNSGQASE